MRKRKVFPEVRFSAEVIREAVSTFEEVVLKGRSKRPYFTVDYDDSSWTYNSIDEFLPEYRKCKGNAYGRIEELGGFFDLSIYVRHAELAILADSRDQIEKVFDVFERHVVQSTLAPLPQPQTPAPETPEPKVFIGHGRSRLWSELKDHLADKHNIKVEAYETGARAGHTIRDILEDMVIRSTFALLILTGEDEQSDGSLRARQNVIHETGLFQGRLGFARAIVLLEEGVEVFSNIQGIQYISFSKGNIKETYGEVVATIRREFPLGRNDRA